MVQREHEGVGVGRARSYWLRRELMGWRCVFRQMAAHRA